MNRPSPVARVLRWSLLAAITLYAVLPFLLLALVAFTVDRGGTSHFGFANFVTVLAEAAVPRALANGVFICGAIVVAQLATALPLGYALAKTRFPLRKAVLGGLYLAMLVPSFAIAVPRFLAFFELGLLDSYAALIFQAIISPFAILLFTAAISELPSATIAAARLDGMREVAILWNIVIPRIRPSIITVIVLSASAHWNDLFWPSLVVQDPSLATPPLEVLFFSDQEAGGGYGPLMAAALLTVLPLLILYMFLQRHFQDSLGGGAGTRRDR